MSSSKKKITKAKEKIKSDSDSEKEIEDEEEEMNEGEEDDEKPFSDVEEEEEIEGEGEEIEDNQEENEQNEQGEEEEEEGEDEENEDKEEKEDEEQIENPEDSDLIQAPIDEMKVDMPEMKLHIEKLIDILSDFKNKKSPDKPRSAYMNELKQYLMQYYDYNEEICELILNLFPPNEALEFMEANNTQKMVTIRTNSLKTKRRELAKDLIQRGVDLDPLAEWSKVGLKIISSTVPIGATPEYLAGHYMLQAASSFLPVLALDITPGENVLDLCAAPGGKSTYIGQLMKGKGILVCNELRKDRIKSLFFNIHRMGITNSIIVNYDGRKISKYFRNYFDKVLLDAPCSGLGVISKDQSVKVNRTYKEILSNSRLQKELILAAIDACRVKNNNNNNSGVIVYSTCSISVQENEWVIDYALKNRYVKCVETGFEIGENGLNNYRDKKFHPSVKNTKRIYPHIHNMDGFFVAKLIKYADGVKGEKKNKEEEGDNVEDEEDEDYVPNEEEDEVEEDDDGKDGIYDDDEDEIDYEDENEVRKIKNKSKDMDKKNRAKDEEVKEEMRPKKKRKISEKEDIKTSHDDEKEKSDKKKDKVKDKRKESKEESSLKKKEIDKKKVIKEEESSPKKKEIDKEKDKKKAIKEEESSPKKKGIDKVKDIKKDIKEETSPKKKEKIKSKDDVSPQKKAKVLEKEKEKEKEKVEEKANKKDKEKRKNSKDEFLGKKRKNK